MKGQGSSRAQSSGAAKSSPDGPRVAGQVRPITYGSVCSGIEADRKCSSCGEEKPASAFHRQGKRGRHAYCKDCYNGRYRGLARKPVAVHARRAQNIKARYGLCPEDVAAMLAEQQGVCAICREPPARPCIDHDHETGRVRGILCHGCNIKLPAVEDTQYLRGALVYLGRRG